MSVTTHGMSLTPEYRAWADMVHRCTNPNARSWQNYGARGITVCEEWLTSFESFFTHVGPRPSTDHSIDRIKNDRGYEPGNVRWATSLQQQNNTRLTKLISAFGEELSTRGWSRKTAIPLSTIRNRLKRGWGIEEALSLPPTRSNRIIRMKRRALAGIALVVMALSGS